MTYNYRIAMLEDVTNWMQEHKDYIKRQGFTDAESLEEWLNDTLWIEDTITGNGQGWYATLWKSEEFLAHNLELYAEACKEFCVSVESIIQGMEEPQIADVTIRCHLLSETIATIINDLMEEGLEEYLVNDADNTEVVVGK